MINTPCPSHWLVLAGEACFPEPLKGTALTTSSAAGFGGADAIIVESSGDQLDKGKFCIWLASPRWFDTSFTTLSLILIALTSNASNFRASDRALFNVEGLEQIMSFASVTPSPSVKQNSKTK